MIYDLVPHAVAWQAAETPDALAVTDVTHTLTYRELEARGPLAALQPGSAAEPASAPTRSSCRRSAF